MTSHTPTHASSRDGSRHSIPPLPADTGAIVLPNQAGDVEDDDNSPASSLLIAILGWTLLLALTLMAFFSAVGALNREIYSASGFVRTYLQMLAAHDVAGALSVPGVGDGRGVPERGSDEAILLDASAVGEMRNIQIVRDDNLGGGRHRVTAHYDLTASGRTMPGSTEFTVVATTPTIGLLNNWRFDRAPTATLTAVVQNAPTFTVGGVTITGDTGEVDEESGGRQFSVLVPGVYTLSHESYYLSAASGVVAVTTVGSDARGYLDVRANQNFVNAVQDRVDQALAECTQQPKLYPTGCPFGKSIDDRIVGEPRWQMVQNPAVRIIPGFGAWYVPEVTGVAHLDVEVRDLFDGTVSSESYDVPFTVSPRLKLDDRNSITLTW